MTLVATCRQFTGTGGFRGYVRDTETGLVVRACTHVHRSRRGPGYTANGRAYISGHVFAMRCAERMLRAVRSGAPR